MSYVDLMSNKVWTDDQINRRLTSAIRSRVSLGAEMKAARLGRKTKPTLADKAFIKQVDDHIAASLADAKLVAVDNNELRMAIQYEEAEARLAQPAIVPRKAVAAVVDKNGVVTTQAVEAITATVDDENGVQIPTPVIETDKVERKADNAVLEAATVSTKALVKKRIPAPVSVPVV